jgi:hypothetical protein
MPATIHGGSLGRWFEELCRIKISRLRDVVAADGSRLTGGRLPTEGGVYAFWWTGDSDLLSHESSNRLIELRGPGQRPVLLEIDDEWLGMSTQLPIPLYVGKNADSISKRIGLHLLLGKQRILPLGGGAQKAKRPTTSCQLRAGVEHFFPNTTDTRSLILENVGLSYVKLHGDQHAANRFYLEDLAIGLMRPPLNVDIER